MHVVNEMYDAVTGSLLGSLGSDSDILSHRQVLSVQENACYVGSVCMICLIFMYGCIDV